MTWLEIVLAVLLASAVGFIGFLLYGLYAVAELIVALFGGRK